MAHEIVNSLRSKSLVRIVGNTAVRIALSDLSASPTETVTGAEVAQVVSVSDGVWRIYRGNDASGVLLLEIPTFGQFNFYEFDISLANNSTSNVYVTNSGTAGTLIMQLTKDATYSVDTGKL